MIGPIGQISRIGPIKGKKSEAAMAGYEHIFPAHISK
jgi:hypothetical protein